MTATALVRINRVYATPPVPSERDLRPGESLWGYVHRLCELNGWGRPHWVLDDIGAKSLAGLSPAQFRRLASITGQSAKRLMASSLIRSDSRWQAFGGRIQTTQYERLRSRICPECFREMRYHLQVWDLRAVSHCPLHGCALVDKCWHRDCHDAAEFSQINALRWRRDSIYECENGHNVMTVEAESCSVEDLAGIRAIYELAGVVHGGPRVIDYFHPDIRRLSVGAFINLVSMTTKLIRFSRDGKYSRVGEVPSAQESAFACTLFADWPNRLDNLMTSIIAQRPNDEATQLLPSSVQRWLMRVMLDRDEQPEIAVFARFAESLAAGHRRRFRGRLDEFIPLSAAGSKMRLVQDSVLKIAELECWEVRQPYRPGETPRVPASKVREWSGRFSTRLKRCAAAIGVGLRSAADLRELVVAGVFGKHASERWTAGQDLSFLSEIEINALISQLDQRINAAAAKEPTLTWRQFRPSDRPNLPRSEAIKAVLEGTLRVAGWQRGNIASLRYVEADLAALARSWRGKSRGRKATATTREIAEEIGVKRQFLLRAIELGLIPATRRSSNTLHVVHRADVKQFLRDHTVTPLIRRKNPMTAAVLGDMIRRARVQPVGGLHGRYAGNRVYRRCDLSRANIPH